jgi:hypothetical protein
MNFSSIISVVVARLKEPSTYAGVAFLAGFVGLKVTPEVWSGAIEVLSAVAGFVAVVLPERK